MSTPNLPGLDPQRVIQRLTQSLAEAYLQAARYAALCDQLVEELQALREPEVREAGTAPS